jgi:hypothetical protein
MPAPDSSTNLYSEPICSRELAQVCHSGSDKLAARKDSVFILRRTEREERRRSPLPIDGRKHIGLGRPVVHIDHRYPVHRYSQQVMLSSRGPLHWYVKEFGLESGEKEPMETLSPKFGVVSHVA